MTLTDRDRKIMLVLVPIVVLAAYWMLLLAPKREEAATAGEELAAQEQRRDAAQMRVDQLSGDRSDFAAEYAAMVRLGKAVPESVDMPTLLVQLQDAAAGTGISFTSISTDDREPAAVVAPPPPAPGTGDGTQPAAAGGEPAQSAPGTAAEAAGDAVAGANTASAAAEQSGVDPADTQTSTQASEGALPVGGGTADPNAAAVPGSSGVLGLDAVPINLTFTGDFFRLSAFFHKLKRYVEADGDRIVVRGRLVVVEGVSFASEPDSFPKLTAEITATAYLAPSAEGVTAGATATGPPATTPVGDGTVTSDAGAATPPTATATR